MKVNDTETNGWARIVAFPERMKPDTAAEVDGGVSRRQRVPRLEAVAERLDAQRGGQIREVDDRIAVSVVAAGLLLCTIGTLVAPVSSRPGIDVSWYGELLSTIFWGGACMGAVGLFYRRRRGLVAAAVAAVAFLCAPFVAFAVDHDVMGRAWGAEVVCALEFCTVCFGALWITRRSRSTPHSQHLE